MYFISFKPKFLNIFIDVSYAHHLYSSNSKITKLYESIKSLVIECGVQLNCANCGIPAMKKCGKCLIVRYCTQECQSKNWTLHKTRCSLYQKQILDLNFETSKSDEKKSEEEVKPIKQSNQQKKSEKRSNTKLTEPTLNKNEPSIGKLDHITSDQKIQKRRTNETNVEEID